MSTDDISLEKVLNSRCSSEFYAGSKSHWGTLTGQTPPKEKIENVIQCLNIPRFSDGKLTHWFKGRYLYLGFIKPNDPCSEQVLHVESGMQQEAVYLACAAQGIGTCIHNEGVNGTLYGETLATTKHLIMEMFDPYETGKFTTKPPGPEKPFIEGRNLSKPSRDGETECLPQLKNLKLSRKKGSSAKDKDISQLLWAAKGRTPHLIRIHKWNYMWGLTIPTWGGGQNYTSVYLMKDKKVFVYINWTKGFSLLNRVLRQKLKWTRGNPTHDIKLIKKLDSNIQIDDVNAAILLCKNENTSRALWEVGYMIENVLLQISSLDISYEAKLFESEEKSELAKIGLKNPVAGIFL